MESSVVVNRCSISSESGQMAGLVETAVIPDCGASRSVSIVGCSFNSQAVLGTDGIATPSPLVAKDVGMCYIDDEFAFVGIDDPGHEQRRVSSVLEFLLLLPPPPTPTPTTSHPSLSPTTHLLSCFFADITVVAAHKDDYWGGAICVVQDTQSQPVSVEDSNFTKIKTTLTGAGMHLNLQQSGMVVDCVFEQCGPPDGSLSQSTGGLEIRSFNPRYHLRATNLVFESCSSLHIVGGMYVSLKGTSVLADCLFNDCSIGEWGMGTGGLDLSLTGDQLTTVARMNFTDCRSADYVGGLVFYAFSDVILTDLSFVRCTAGRD
ncbi:hypothetical protein BLNAU_12192 [Blattamonas nauphoetae]|uniref:Right handed beta helix domain-containing protein n=1 Tax=Blattamonas nauphoetae TaxID=2049346 RepID=A0ABQ9XR78_9EUKA|nr:hypothetical protein BLNAU_12192 [Blattamonas nauphoetae]